MNKFIVVILAVVLTACSAAPAGDFEANRAKWQRSGVDSYRLSIHIICFCPFVDKMPLTVEVRDGQIVSIAAADGTPVDSSDPGYEFFVPYTTIDGIFAELESELATADEVVATYDPTYGYPTEVNIDRIREAIDDELSLQVAGFEVLP